MCEWPLHWSKTRAEFPYRLCGGIHWTPITVSDNTVSSDTFAVPGKTGFELAHWETYSMKSLANFIYTRVPIGNKARALARKREI